jgi:HSP20 family protein
MSITDLLPWTRGGVKVPVKHNSDLAREFPGQFDRVMEEFFNNPFTLAPFKSLMGSDMTFYPPVDISEDEKVLKVSAEIPGMDENDIQVSLSNDVLTIIGHKETEKEEQTRHFHRMERTSGSFQREIQLPVDVEDEKVEAIFKKGVLTITLPKTGNDLTKGKRIVVRKE